MDSNIIGLIAAMIIVTGIIIVYFKISETKRPCPSCRAMMPIKKETCPRCGKGIPLHY